MIDEVRDEISPHAVDCLSARCFFYSSDRLTAQTIHVSIRGKAVEGKPLYWNNDFVALMARDGQLVTFAPHEAEAFRQVSAGFSSHSQATLRGELLREFGRRL